MKIENSYKTVGNTGGDLKARATRASPAQAGASSSDVELSPLASQISKLTGTSEASQVDAAKVREIKQAISEGRFEVHAEKVADGLISSVRQMLQAQARSA
ncbi:flagellar biosynthesis anti-sigma factor FlgM [Niveibacterium terrae]|uniref:flagellar biosynthesis anti-sigma factor FlgM n=1 Tax=Niveibacterium terrae TaxID=3373598 RepID=UPI003A93EC05